MKSSWFRFSCLIVTIVGVSGFAAAQSPLTCGTIGNPGFLLGQDAHDPANPDLDIMSSCQSTWNNFITAETVDQAADPDWFDITSLTVWGLSLVNNGGIANCDPTGLSFEVIFYEDNAGEPGTVICGPQTVVSSSVNTGLILNDVFDINRFDMAATCDFGSIGRKWMTVQSLNNTSDCCFVWLSGTGGDGESLQDGGMGWDLKDNDRSFCVNGAAVPVQLESLSIE